MNLCRLTSWLIAALLITAQGTRTPGQDLPTPAMEHVPESKVALAEPDHSVAVDAEPVGIEYGLGYASYPGEVKTGYWYPAWAIVQARKYDISGTLTFKQEDNPLEVSLPVQIAKGTTKRFATYFQPRDPFNLQGGFSLRLQSSGHKDILLQSPIRFASDISRLILVLADDNSGNFQFLVRRKDPKDLLGSNPLGDRFVVYGSVELLPEDSIALEALDAIIINTSAVRLISPDQWNAIQNWIYLGGNLLIAGGDHRPFIEQSHLKNAFGIELAPLEPAMLKDALGAKAKIETTLEFLASWPSSRQGDARVLQGSAERPFLLTRNIGRGHYHVCAAALRQPILDLLNSIPENASLWSELLERYPTEDLLQQIVRKTEPYIGSALQFPFSSNLVGIWWVIGFLSTYLIAVVPLNWWICRKLKRPEWAWSAAVVIAFLFTAYGYFSGKGSHERDLLVNEFTFVSRPAASPVSRTVTLGAIYAPRRFRADLTSAARAFPSEYECFDPNFGFQHQRRDELPLNASFDKASSLSKFFLYSWSARTLRTDFILPASGGIRLGEPLSIAESTQELAGRIENATPWEFDRWWIVNGRRAWRGTTALAPAASFDLKDAPLLPEFPLSDQIQDQIAAKMLKRSKPQVSSEWGMDFEAMFARLVIPEWRATPITSSGAEALVFVGMGSGGGSPLLESLTSAVRTGIVLYEEDLQALPPSSRRLTDPALLGWAVKPLTDERPRALGPAWNDIQRRRGQSYVPFEIVDVQFIPESPVADHGNHCIMLALQAVLNPGDEVAPAAGPGKDGSANPFQPVDNHLASSSRGRVTFQFASIPVSIFNVKTQAWEALPDWDIKPHEIYPLGNYLNPVSSILTLRLDLREDKIKVHVAEGPYQPPAQRAAATALVSYQSLQSNVTQGLWLKSHIALKTRGDEAQTSDTLLSSAADPISPRNLSSGGDKPHD